MSDSITGNAPGFEALSQTDEAQVWWSGRGGQNLVATRMVTIDKSAVDAGNTPATTLRPGMVLAIQTASGKALPYDPDANDGTQNACGILEHAQDMLVDGVATDRFTQMLTHGLVRESALVGLDPRAKAQLAGRFVFDKDLDVAPGQLSQPRGVTRVSSAHTVEASENGTLFIATAAVAFTLPTKQNGLAYRFVQSANDTLQIIGSGDIIASGSPVTSMVEFSTSNEKVGSQLLVECVYVADGSLKWIATNLGGTTATLY